MVHGQSMVPDTTGVTPGGTKLYTFTPNRPGTYLYEAGLLPNAQHQTAMGLHGALIVRPHAGANHAYTSDSTTFDDEAVLVLSELDPALNANPATFDMRHYKPKYFLINGKAYPSTDPIPTVGGHRVVLRYLNAGIDYHSMAVLGAHQTVIALDGNPLADSRRYVAETFGPGQTADAIVTAPAATASTNRLAIYDGNLLLHNSNSGGFGGMLTFLEVAAGSAWRRHDRAGDERRRLRGWHPHGDRQRRRHRWLEHRGSRVLRRHRRGARHGCRDGRGPAERAVRQPDRGSHRHGHPGSHRRARTRFTCGAGTLLATGAPSARCWSTAATPPARRRSPRA